MLNKIKYLLGILLALATLSVFVYLIYQVLAKPMGLPESCEISCKYKGFPTGKCLRSNEVESDDVHNKKGFCVNPIDEHCSFPGICRCMCKDPNVDFEF